MHHHSAGNWMFEYRYMRMNMNGLRDGTTDIDSTEISGATSSGLKSPNKPYQMAPVSMTMSMQMLMAMYAINQNVSVMAIGNYLDNSMSMVMHHGAGTADVMQMHADMETRGIGDTQIAVSYAISEPLTLSLGLSLPTGSTEERVSMKPGDPTVRAGYSMQLGSGTFDLIPGMLWNHVAGDRAWGGQASYTYRLGSNNGYTFGSKLESSAWAKYQVDPGVWISARLAITHADKVDGSDVEIDAAMSPEMDPNAQGGTRADALIGISGGNAKGLTLGIEIGIPVYQRLNGPQMKTTLMASGLVQWQF